MLFVYHNTFHQDIPTIRENVKTCNEQHYLYLAEEIIMPFFHPCINMYFTILTFYSRTVCMLKKKDNRHCTKFN
jgi:hypothetical protein